MTETLPCPACGNPGVERHCDKAGCGWDVCLKCMGYWSRFARSRFHR